MRSRADPVTEITVFATEKLVEVTMERIDRIPLRPTATQILAHPYGEKETARLSKNINLSHP